MVRLDLTGRAGIVTGGAAGLGEAQVAALREAGANVAVLDIHADAVAALDAGACEAAIVCDVSDPESVGRAFGDAVGALGRLDFLVNNAGIRVAHRFEDYPLDAWHRTLDVNLTGPFLCSQAAVPYMRAAGKGKIVNIASIAGELVFEDRVAYNASKHGVRGLTKAIALELGADNIYCNAIAPGIVETPMTAHYFDDPGLRESIVSKTPLARWAQPREIAEPVVFLCSDASDFVSGTTLFVDGGWVAGKRY